MSSKIFNFAFNQLGLTSYNKSLMKSFKYEYDKVFRKKHSIGEDLYFFNYEERIEEIRNLTESITEIFNRRINELSKWDIKENLDLIMFLGDGKIDGNSIFLNNKYYVFIDLSSLIDNKSRLSTLNIFISHEIIHAIHYSLNNSFYPKNYGDMKDIYLKRLIAEGIATYFTIELFNFNEEEAFWLNTINKEKVNMWKMCCIKEKKAIYKEVCESIVLKKYNNKLYNKLFCFTKNNYKISRMGYYYGVELIKVLNKDKEYKRILKLDLESILKSLKNVDNKIKD